MTLFETGDLGAEHLICTQFERMAPWPRALPSSAGRNLAKRAGRMISAWADPYLSDS